MGMVINSEIKKLFVGNEEVKEAYIGSNKIYSKQVDIVPENYVIIAPQNDLQISYRGRTPSDYIEYCVFESPDNVVWNKLNSNDMINISLGFGVILLRANLVPAEKVGIGRIMIDGECFLAGNCMALLYGDESSGKTAITYDYAFYGLFSSCLGISFVDYSFLPATSLSAYCYGNMFRGCTNMAVAPLLPATDLVGGCYDSMFYNCQSLNTIYANFKTTPNDDYTKQWVSGVAGNGVFYRNKNASWNVIGNNGIPSGWTIQNL